MRIDLFRFLMLLVCVLVVREGKAALIPPIFHEEAAHYGLKGEWLYALAQTETNTLMNTGRMSIWPWVINFKGTAKYFPNEQMMCNQAIQYVREGKELFDVGLMQVNWYWHKKRVNDISDLCDLRTNIHIGAQIFAEQYKRFKDPVVAAGRYHNPANNRGAADRYGRRFARHLKGQ